MKMLEDRIMHLEQKRNISFNETDRETTNFQCKECPETFSKKSNLKKHLLALHPKQYPCKICEQCFETSISLELHLNTHTIDRQFECQVCNKTFHMKWRFKKHLQQHESQNWKY